MRESTAAAPTSESLPEQSEIGTTLTLELRFWPASLLRRLAEWVERSSAF
ncbi:MAG TPA: hypothetical protein VN841_17805 [Bryobacteraceae bacterium]|nr:hypothetical protein [Bryobacteraceae bacterium]